MAKQRKIEVVYKEQITRLFLVILEIAAKDVKNDSNFETNYQKRLKFQKITDWKKYRACVDLIDDTEYAIFSAFQYQLGDISNNKDFGEKYLRLYGVLNAVYLQMNAISNLANLLNYPQRNEIMPNFQNLDIYKLRGIAGAHTTDYMYDKITLASYSSIHKNTSFRIVQMHLEKTGSKIVVLDENNIQFEFNLLSVLSEYENIEREIIVSLINHMIDTMFFKQEQKIELRKNLNNLLPKLIIYANVNKNNDYKLEKAKRQDELLTRIKKNIPKYKNDYNNP